MKDTTEDSCNDTYGRTPHVSVVTMKQPKNVDIPSERTVYRVMEEIDQSSSQTQTERDHKKRTGKVKKSEGSVKRDFTAEEPLTKCVTDMTRDQEAVMGKHMFQPFLDRLIPA